jgi:uracil-DNA glycosylase
MPTKISQLQMRIVDEYAADLGLESKPAYISGAPLRPLPPLDVGTDSVMILGAYPSARFGVVSGIRDVPVGDNMGPFEPERYFDGQRVRTQASADELRDLFFNPLGLDRAECWVTDIVKVFLFKEGHRKKYESLGATPPQGYRREEFERLASESIRWLEKEIEAAAPRLLVTLGSEIAGLLRSVQSQKSRNALLTGEPRDLTIGRHAVRTVHLAHPGILMRKGDPERNPWPARHVDHLAKLKASLVEVGLTC